MVTKRERIIYNGLPEDVCHFCNKDARYLDGLTYQIKHATNAPVDDLSLEPVIVKVHEDQRSGKETCVKLMVCGLCRSYFRSIAYEDHNY